MGATHVVDTLNPNVYLVTFVNYGTCVLDVFLGHARDVNESLFAGKEFDKAAVSFDTDDFAIVFFARLGDVRHTLDPIDGFVHTSGIDTRNGDLPNAG